MFPVSMYMQWLAQLCGKVCSSWEIIVAVRLWTVGCGIVIVDCGWYRFGRGLWLVEFWSWIVAGRGLVADCGW